MFRLHDPHLDSCTSKELVHTGLEMFVSASSPKLIYVVLAVFIITFTRRILACFLTPVSQPTYQISSGTCTMLVDGSVSIKHYT